MTKMLKLETGKLYRVLIYFVAEKGYVEEDGEPWTGLTGVRPGEIFLYLGFYPPHRPDPLFKEHAMGVHHILMKNGATLHTPFEYRVSDTRSKGEFVEEIKTHNT